MGHGGNGKSRQQEDEEGYEILNRAQAALRPGFSYNQLQEALDRGTKADRKPSIFGVREESRGETEMRVCEAVLKILRKIHDPNRLTQFQKDLAWLQKEWS